MREETPNSAKKTKHSRMTKSIIFIALGILLFAWLLNTPPGLLGKADAVGYAVCHRIDIFLLTVNAVIVRACVAGEAVDVRPKNGWSFAASGFGNRV